MLCFAEHSKQIKLNETQESRKKFLKLSKNMSLNVFKEITKNKWKAFEDNVIKIVDSSDKESNRNPNHCFETQIIRFTRTESSEKQDHL